MVVQAVRQDRAAYSGTSMSLNTLGFLGFLGFAEGFGGICWDTLWVFWVFWVLPRVSTYEAPALYRLGRPSFSRPLSFCSLRLFLFWFSVLFPPSLCFGFLLFFPLFVVALFPAL